MEQVLQNINQLNRNLESIITVSPQSQSTTGQPYWWRTGRQWIWLCRSTMVSVWKLHGSTGRREWEWRWENEWGSWRGQSTSRTGWGRGEYFYPREVILAFPFSLGYDWCTLFIVLFDTSLRLGYRTWRHFQELLIDFLIQYTWSSCADRK